MQTKELDTITAATSNGDDAVEATTALGLSEAQRYHIDANGYVIVSDVVSPEQIAAAKAALDELNADPSPRDRGAINFARLDHYVHFSNPVQYSPAIADIAFNPFVLSAMTDLIGGQIRLEESEAIINRRAADQDPGQRKDRRSQALSLHRGLPPEIASYERNGRRQYLWVKALTFLTDIGPDDGGTVFVRGSHRLPGPAAMYPDMADDSILEQAQGTAGSVAFMVEATVHSVSPIWSDRTRYMVVNGYTASFMSQWVDNEHEAFSESWIAGLSEDRRAVATGRLGYWSWVG